MQPSHYPKKQVIAVMCCFLSVYCFHIQGQNLDSLETVLQTQNLPPALQLDIYYKLSWGYMDTQTGKSFYYAKKGIELAEKEKEPESAAKLYGNLGVAYDMTSNYDSAMFCFDKALNLALRINNEQQIARINTCIGNLHLGKGEHHQALDYYLKALPLIEKQGNRVWESIIIHNIGDIYQNLSNWEAALDYFLKEEAIARETGDRESLGHALNSISGVWLHAGENREQALDYALQAAGIFQEANDLYAESMARLNISQIYYSLNDFPTALEHAEKALQLAQELEYPKNISRSLFILSEIAYSQGQYSECESLALKALETDSTDLNVVAGLIANIAYANSKMGNADQSVVYFDKYRTMIYDRATKEYQNSLSEMTVIYETEKKELKITALEKEKQVYYWQRIAGIALLLFVLVLFITNHRRAAQNRKLAEQRIKQLEKEKQLVATQAVLDGETAERSRLARDLHDGLGGLLSAVKLNLYEIKKGVTMESDKTVHFDQTMGLFEKSITELRRVAHNLMPESLTHSGLTVSLTDFFNTIPNAEFHYFGTSERLNPRLEAMVYRIALELVNNALKHANASRIVVQIVQEQARLSLIVQDDGCGFDTSAHRSGAGLHNIRNRVEACNGRIDISSQPGEGTEINIEINIV